MNNDYIPIYSPDLSGNERKYLNECIDTGWISSRGKFIEAFETSFANRVGVDHATAVSNGTVALHLALVALGIGPGDEVIVPTLSYIASANSIAYTGATPVFVDSTPNTWQLDPADVVRHITAKTRAIMPVHLYGQACEMDEICEIARQHRLFIIEDCAEGFGTLYKGKHVGTFGDISTFSFFGNKTITTGEGGMVISNDKTLIERARHLRGQGLATHREYWHDVIGYNYRMANIPAALGLAQLERADEFIAKKRALAAKYMAALEGLPLKFQQEAPHTTHSYWMFSILVDTPTQRDELRKLMRLDNIETRPVFYPMHTMPMYSRNFNRHKVAENIAWRGINLPSWPGLSEKQINRITSSIRTHYKNLLHTPKNNS